VNEETVESWLLRGSAGKYLKLIVAQLIRCNSSLTEPECSLASLKRTEISVFFVATARGSLALRTDEMASSSGGFLSISIVNSRGQTRRGRPPANNYVIVMQDPQRYALRY
jgi:hypothetical protein